MLFGFRSHGVDKCGRFYRSAFPTANHISSSNIPTPKSIPLTPTRIPNTHPCHIRIDDCKSLLPIPNFTLAKLLGRRTDIDTECLSHTAHAVFLDIQSAWDREPAQRVHRTERSDEWDLPPADLDAREQDAEDGGAHYFSVAVYDDCVEFGRDCCCELGGFDAGDRRDHYDCARCDADAIGTI